MPAAVASIPVWQLASSSSNGSRVAACPTSGLPSPSCFTSRATMGTCSLWGCNVARKSVRDGSPMPEAASMPAVTPLADLYDFICKGPLLERIGLDAEDVRRDMNEWIEMGLRLSRILGFRELMLSESEKARVYHYYLPVYMWCKRELERHRGRFNDGDKPIPALVIGISAPQGCGKTTLVDALEYMFNYSGRTAASVSIDDFYLTAADQQTLAKENQGNLLLELRGNAGSHDLDLGTQTIKSLQNLAEGEVASVPHYDKSAYNGRGDRSDPSTWSKVTGPLQVILFEGWMLGFKPLGKAAVSSVDPQLEVVDKNLVAYQKGWFSLVDSWIIVKVDDPGWVYEWRLEAEIAMKAKGKPGMSDEQVADFVARYMPAYKAYLETLYSEGPGNAKPDNVLKFSIDKNRNPVG
ncbi:D-glycerate 3-kinase, chloroplastic [Selaginella moellendorffii]|uniref:D-glycerate 3-kinase, chloroplastic n=1 Tax=Selaginella moellendorffii TaxID=88036 RepID=UPI000D1C3990|nr:D-glycerate 3-kinase, chloroplastic [Selaginella moellendorffii]|eukprot:XP_024545180.1 D-glycerate 3-kinase, chloroplastic [Selaginella moellendorffii]